MAPSRRTACPCDPAGRSTSRGSPGSRRVGATSRPPGSPIQGRSSRSGSSSSTRWPASSPSRRPDRVRRLRGVTGLLLVDKPAGPTSFDIIRRLRPVLGPKLGHAGTLDPFATGLLLVLAGRATRLAPYLSRLDKRYTATVRFGAVSATHDPEGPIQSTGGRVDGAGGGGQAGDAPRGGRGAGLGRRGRAVARPPRPRQRRAGAGLVLAHPRPA